MSARVEAAAASIGNVIITRGSMTEAATSALAAADSVMFSEAAIERAAKVMFPSYWDPDFYHAHSEATGNVIEESQRQCIDHVRAVVAALREET